MFCDRCQKNDARVHLTEIGPDESTSNATRNFCQACGDEYMRESKRLLEYFSVSLKQDMPQMEKDRLAQEFFREYRRQMNEWMSKGQST